jgi:hypothetical protein
MKRARRQGQWQWQQGCQARDSNREEVEGNVDSARVAGNKEGNSNEEGNGNSNEGSR